MISAAEPAEALDAAADHLEQYGWWIGDDPGGHTGGVGRTNCARGAVRAVVGHDGSALFWEVDDLLAAEVGRPVVDWNGQKGQTGENVIATLRRVANHLRGAE